ncbi:MAG: EAL domain-containing protein [Sphingomonadaceae bacterium]
MEHGPAEASRLAALRSLEILDTEPEPQFDLITNIATRIFEVPVAIVSLVEEKRQWFKAKTGTSLCETRRDIAFCNHAIEGDGLFEVTDAAADPRFADNPLVTGEPHLRYYAGHPLRLASGHLIGTLCLIDIKPRPALDREHGELLRRLAELVVVEIELRQSRLAGETASAIIAATPDAIVFVDRDDRITHWNPAAEKMFDYSAEEMAGASIERIVPPDLRAVHREWTRQLFASGTHRLLEKPIETTALRRDGSLIETEMTIATWRREDGRPGGYGAIIRDQSKRKALERDHAATRRFLRTIVEHLPAMLFVKDARSFDYLLWNDAAERMTGRSREEVTGRNDTELFPDKARLWRSRDKRTLKTGEPERHEGSFLREDGEPRVLRTTRVAVPDETGKPAYILGLTEDLSEWRHAQQQVAFLAGHDPTTHLRNRKSFIRVLEEECGRGTGAAVLALEINRFETISEIYGREGADLLLVRLAALLVAAAEGKAEVSRIGAGQFALLVCGKNAAARARRLARKIVDRLAKPLEIEAGRLRVNVNIGIAAAAAGERSIHNLLNNAEVALRRSGSGNGGCVCVYDAEMGRAVRARRDTETYLNEAIERGDIEIHYQPIAEVDSGAIRAFEALARWQHPELGRVSPELFIPIAEESGMIVPLGLQVLRKAMIEAARWHPPLGISINLSPLQIQHPGFAAEVRRILEESGLDPKRLDLEITEGVLADDPDNAVKTLLELKQFGIDIALDDFGTGYSSLSYFRMFPFHKLKIDQGFVRDMTASHEARAIVEAAIGIARGLGLKVVAEGVEEEAQLRELAALGCDYVQGYMIGRPGAIEAFAPAVVRREAKAVRDAA